MSKVGGLVPVLARQASPEALRHGAGQPTVSLPTDSVDVRWLRWERL